MRQIIIALAALVSTLHLSHTERKVVHSGELEVLKNEVEMGAGTLGSSLLDFADTLPLGNGMGADSPLATYYDARSVDELDGYHQDVEMQFEGGTVVLDVYVEVVHVEKVGHEYVPTNQSTPFRSIRVGVMGPLNVRVVLERVYARRS